MMSAMVLQVALTVVSVPPGAPVIDHSHPGHYAQPTLRRFERRAVDNDRRQRWESFNRQLDLLWAQYVAAGRTPVAWEAYKDAVAAARRDYIYADPHYAPVLNYEGY